MIFKNIQQLLLCLRVFRLLGFSLLWFLCRLRLCLLRFFSFWQFLRAPVLRVCNVNECGKALKTRFLRLPSKTAFTGSGASADWLPPMLARTGLRENQKQHMSKDSLKLPARHPS